MKQLRKTIFSNSGKSVIAFLLLALLLNNIVIPEMERLNPQREIPNNSSNMIEVIIEEIVENDLFEADEEDDSSDNLTDSIQKYIPYSIIISNFIAFNKKNENYFISNHLNSSKGFQSIDLPPPKFE